MLNRNTSKKIAVLLLAAQLCLAGTACQSSEPGPSDDTDPADTSADSTSDVTTADPHTPLPEGDFTGETINFFLWDETTFAVEKETGDVVDDAIYKRNLAVQEAYGVEFTYNLQPGGMDFDSWFATLSASIMSNDNSIQMAGGYAYRLAANSMTGLFHNLNEISAIDFSKPWWPGNLQQAGNIGDNMYIAVGNIEPNYYNWTYAMYFSKPLADELKIPSLYDTVKAGEWTYDKFVEYIKLATHDMNGDSKMDASDRYGLSLAPYMDVDAFYNAFDIQSVEYDEDNMPSIGKLNAHHIDVQSKLRELFLRSGDVYYDINADRGNMFIEARSLFFPTTLSTAKILRSSEMDFGILPYPKWDDAQDDYYTHNAFSNTTAYAIPITADGEMMGTILEALAIRGYEDILPAYYDIALKVKGIRDEESAEMLDIIFENVTFDFTQLYSFAFGDQLSPSMLLRSTILQDMELATMWGGLEQLFKGTMDYLISSLK